MDAWNYHFRQTSLAWPREGCLGHSVNKEAAPNESISAPLPLQEGRKKPQSALKSGLTLQQLSALQSIRNPLDEVWCHHTWQVDPDILSFVENIMFASPGCPSCKM